KKNLGNVVIVNLYQKLDNKKEFKGILKDFNNQEISLELEKNQIKIERSNISSIKLSLFD
ncbi:MAG: hypothetical protein E7B94_23125, partial [Enterobacter sp.]|nr:hypothetical protein [Enterobacter sp.]